jgi:Heterokaryon incompatibility protein (HET)
LNSHTKCNSSDSIQSFSPSRLLDIGDADKGIITLRITKEHDTTGRYIALSHCWGELPMLKLVDRISADETGVPVLLKRMKAGFSVADLPKTFREAVAIARRLSVRYLWIDSLCIVQNSKEDWKRESAKMGSVYSNAFCTLAAAGSKDSSEGLFHERAPSLARPIAVKPTWEKIVEQSYLVVPLDFWDDMVSESVLGQRGWVLQERLLSPRFIHYGRTQIFWECRSQDCCETFPTGLPDIASGINSRFKGLDPECDGPVLRKLKLARDPPQAFIRPHPATVNDGLGGYYVWSRILEKYCGTRLTYESDKLAAIIGLGKDMQRVLEDEYVSGLWRSILPSQLLWRVQDYTRLNIFDTVAKGNFPTQPKGSRPEGRVAPTWSWASVNGPIVAPVPVRGTVLFDDCSPFRVKRSSEELDDDPLQIYETLHIRNATLHFASLLFHPSSDTWFLQIVPRGVRYSHPSNTEPERPKVFPNFDDIGYLKYSRKRGFLGLGRKVRGIAHIWGVPWPKVSPAAAVFALAYPDAYDPELVPDPKLATVSCIVLPVLDTNSSVTAALQVERATRMSGVSGLILRPYGVKAGPDGMTLAYTRIGCFDIPDLRSKDGGNGTKSSFSDGLGLRAEDLKKEYCNGEQYRSLFARTERPNSHDILLS